MRFSLPSLVPVLGLLAACSNSSTEQAATTKTETMADTASKVSPASPAAPADSATLPPAKATAQLAPDTAGVQGVANYLAGLPPQTGTSLASLAAQPAWQYFAKDQDKSWAKYRATHTDPMEHWAATELDSVRQVSPTLFYPFSGPDFLNAFTLFPTSSTYVMIGLEPVGNIPTPDNLANPVLLGAVKKSLWSVLNFSFFRTNDMAIDLKSVNLDGAVPLIMLFAARTGNHLQSVRPVQLDAQGQLQEVTDTTRAPSANQKLALAKVIPGAELKIQAADGTEKTIYYFSADLSDWKLGTTSAPLKYVRSLGPLTTYVKSATYLMHKSYFSKIRNLVLERSNYLLQDDSGIAMKYFPKSAWQFTYYGTYRRPINHFAKQYQPELTTAYHDSLRRARPLPFGTGYNWRQTDSNLLLAKRRTPISK